MKQVLIKSGNILIDEVPAPLLDDDTILVEVAYSLISTGTELSTISSSSENILQKAITHPEKIKKVIDFLRSQSISKTISFAKSKLDVATSIGYSLSGYVIGVGKNIIHIKVGDKVACAGAGYANHAEIICVPKNLVVKIPDDCLLEDAASIALGAIAMQGVRRADVKLGEIVVIFGLGLLGQITLQLLKVAGCKVIGIDIRDERCEMAKFFGGDLVINSKTENIVKNVSDYTRGYFADAVIITAASKDENIIQKAMEITRKKGKVIAVGDVPLLMERSPFYEKEIDFLISTSYGPGRYDENYEKKGADYPYYYIRWTENRNMEEYLSILSQNKINFRGLIGKIYNIQEAEKAYQELKEGKYLTVLLKYDVDEEIDKKLKTKISHQVDFSKESKINVGVIGAGDFAKAMHLPNLLELKNLYNIYGIVCKSGHNAVQVAKKFKAICSSTDYQDILSEVDMVLISTRHNLHAKITQDAIRAKKSVFVEKPVALNSDELNKVIDVWRETKVPFTVGFNRRFSPAARIAKKIIAKKQNPLIIFYRVNAGYIPPNNWMHQDEGGGRIIGECGHFFDLFNFLVEDKIESIDASSISPKTENILSDDNFTTTLKYLDGSLCTLLYTSLGTDKLPKEYIEIYCDGKILIIDDFKELKIFGGKEKGWKSLHQDKGHKQELIEFAECVQGKRGLPISIEDIIQATEISFIIDEMVRKS